MSLIPYNTIAGVLAPSLAPLANAYSQGKAQGMADNSNQTTSTPQDNGTNPAASLEMMASMFARMQQEDAERRARQGVIGQTQEANRLINAGPFGGRNELRTQSIDERRREMNVGSLRGRTQAQKERDEKSRAATKKRNADKKARRANKKQPSPASRVVQQSSALAAPQENFVENRTPEQERQLQIDLANAYGNLNARRKEEELQGRRDFTANLGGIPPAGPYLAPVEGRTPAQERQLQIDLANAQGMANAARAEEEMGARRDYTFDMRNNPTVVNNRTPEQERQLQIDLANAQGSANADKAAAERDLYERGAFTSNLGMGPRVGSSHYGSDHAGADPTHPLRLPRFMMSGGVDTPEYRYPIPYPTNPSPIDGRMGPFPESQFQGPPDPRERNIGYPGNYPGTPIPIPPFMLPGFDRDRSQIELPFRMNPMDFHRGSPYMRPRNYEY